jgi:hypothetical protein
MKDGATMEGVTFSQITMETTDPKIHRIFPIFMDVEKRNPDSKIGKIRDVTFRDLTIRSGSGALVQGMPESPIENLTVENLTFRVERADDYTGRRKTVGGRRTTRGERDTIYARQPSYLTFAHIDGLTLDNVRVFIRDEAYTKWNRCAVSGHHLANGTLRGIARRPAGRCGTAPVVALHDCRSMLVTGCRAAPGTPVFLALHGAATKDIAVTGNDFHHATRPVARDGDVPAAALHGAVQPGSTD